MNPSMFPTVSYQTNVSQPGLRTALDVWIGHMQGAVHPAWRDNTEVAVIVSAAKRDAGDLVNGTPGYGDLFRSLVEVRAAIMSVDSMGAVLAGCTRNEEAGIIFLWSRHAQKSIEIHLYPLIKGGYGGNVLRVEHSQR